MAALTQRDLDRHCKRLRSRGIQDDDARDAISEAFVQLLKKGRAVDCPDELIQRLAGHRACDRFRRSRVHAQAVAAFERRLDTDGLATLDEVERAEAITALRSAMEQLPEPIRRVLDLSLSEASPEEIACQLGITPGAVPMRVSRAREKLRAALVRL